jgi:phosphoribosylaminoimidazole-succinocarboxamide synthase
MQALSATQLQFGCHYEKRQGKVRDVYVFEESVVALVATDRVSAFDVIFTEPIPYKGQVLSQLATFFLEQTRHICPNHFIASPDPNVVVGTKADVYPIEVIVRGHLCGHAWREYKAGKRVVSGVALPEGLKENDPLPQPVITPTTKSTIGHDIDITEDEIVRSGLVPADEWMMIKHYALALFEFGQAHARKCGLVLADTKYEFGNRDLSILLVDELHTPDSSRYFYADGFEDRQARGEAQEHISKEHLRKWLLGIGYQGQEDLPVPHLSPEIVTDLSQRYIGVYERMTGLEFRPRNYATAQDEMQAGIQTVLAKLGIKG